LDREEKQMGNPVVHFEVVGKDAEALQSFYEEAFDWQMQITSGVPTYAMAYPGVEGGISGGVGAVLEGGEGHVTFYVGVPDLEAALSRIENLGGSRVMGPMDVPDGPSIAMFTDPEGHLVGLLKTGT
jgi:predicted enzyme related to lactoylglutathione lyase